MLNPDSIVDLYSTRGDIAYDGEGVTQLEHGWQCGQLARKAGASLELQLASWLHDLGHLLSPSTGSPTLMGIDDEHQNSAAGVLVNLWGEAVSEPVRLHVEAKRYLVATRPAYAATLSPDSVRSLSLQGGPMDDDQCRLFEFNPYFRQALQLRSWDDTGKMTGWFPSERSQALDDLRSLMNAISR